jgi:hypothetical protein
MDGHIFSLFERACDVRYQRDAAGVEAGSPRSGMGNEMNRMPLLSAAWRSVSKSSWSASSLASKETTTSIPLRHHALASSSSQSSPLWPGDHGQTSPPRTGNRKHLRVRHSFSLISRGRLLMSMPRSRRNDQAWPRFQGICMCNIERCLELIRAKRSERFEFRFAPVPFHPGARAADFPVSTWVPRQASLTWVI